MFFHSIFLARVLSNHFALIRIFMNRFYLRFSYHFSFKGNMNLFPCLFFASASLFGVSHPSISTIISGYILWRLFQMPFKRNSPGFPGGIVGNVGKKIKLKSGIQLDRSGWSGIPPRQFLSCWKRDRFWHTMRDWLRFVIYEVV